MKYLLLTILVLWYRQCQAYKAAVLEYRPSKSDTPEDTILKNLDIYRTYADEARQQSVDIIIFPEYGLTTLVDDPQAYALEFTNETKALRELEAIAKERHIYVVVNLLEKETDDDNVTKYYNTNLVYDKDGNIIAKYRKINLNNEDKLTAGNDTVTFTTDLGVTFGIFTSNDLLFYHPSRSILRDDAVTDIIVPSAWKSHVPLYASLSVQHGYGVANGVNLLVAGYNDPNNGYGGSGIYTSGGTAETYVGNSSRLIVHDVYKIEEKQDRPKCDSVGTTGVYGTSSNTSKFSDTEYTYKDVDLSGQEVSTSICHRSFCCNFMIATNQTPTKEFYKLAAFDGQTSPENHIRFCALVACENNTSSSCGTRLSGTISFKKIIVGAHVEAENGTFYTPLTLTHDLVPLTQSGYCASASSNATMYIQVSSFASQDNVLVFGIFGNANSTIRANETGSAVKRSKLFSFAIIFVVSILFL